MANAPTHNPPEPNVGTAERIGSAIVGAVLIGRALLRPSLGRLIAAFGGAALLQRGLTGHSALYRALGVDTAAQESRPHPAAAMDPVQEASEESFPASDPPSWNPISGTGVHRRPTTH